MVSGLSIANGTAVSYQLDSASEGFDRNLQSFERISLYARDPQSSQLESKKDCVINSKGLFIQKLPGFRAVELPDLYTGGILPLHHSRVYCNPAILILFDVFIMCRATTGFAVIELNTFIAPKISCSRGSGTRNPDLLTCVISPLRPQAVAN